MPDDQGQLRLAQVTIDHVEVCAADAAGAHCDQNLARARVGRRQLRLAERLALGVEHHRAHAVAHFGAPLLSPPAWAMMRPARFMASIRIPKGE
jgi:hypothetical protein